MNVTFESTVPADVVSLLDSLRANGEVELDDPRNLNHLFNEDRRLDATDLIVMRDCDHSLLGLALVNKWNPQVLSLYTLQKHRRKGCGAKLLRRCVDQIDESRHNRNAVIHIDPTDAVVRLIRAMPEQLSCRFRWIS